MSAAARYEWVNPKSLEQARKRLRLEAKEVVEQAKQLGSDYAGITEQTLHAWETGKSEPELRHIEALSQIYVCPVGWFFLSSIPTETPGLDFRGVASGAKVGGRGMQTLSRFLELAEWAEGVAVQTGQFVKPAIGQASVKDNIDNVVATERRRLHFDPEVRSAWEHPKDAFNWWRRQIEDLGVYCFLMRLPSEEIRGVSHRGQHGGAFILVNSEDAELATGRTFTLLHEYAHLMLRKSLVCDFRGREGGTQIERFANRFAARMLLVPAELQTRLEELDLRESRDEWSDGLLDKIREPFCVSRDVVAICLEELDLAPKGFYASKRAIWSKRKPFGRSKLPQKGRTQATQRLKMVGGTLARVLASEAAAVLPALEIAEVLEVKVERIPEVLRVFRQAEAAS